MLLVLVMPAALCAQDSARGDLTLRTLLASIAASHPRTEAAMARVRAALGARATAGTLGNPVLSYQVDNTPFPRGRPIDGLDREAMTAVSLPLEPFYQRGARLDRASAALRAAEADVVVARQRLALDAERVYYRVALGQVTVAVARDLSAWLDTVVAYNRSRVKEGVASEADLIRARLERDRADAEAVMGEAELAQSRAELAGILGVSYDGRRPPRVAPPQTPLALATSDSGSVVLNALAVRPELRASRERLAAATASIASEQRMFIRQVGATIGTKQTAGSTSMIAGLSLPLPLFDANHGGIQRATAERLAAGHDLAAAERAVTADVEAAYEAARQLSQQVAVLQRSFLDRAEESRRITLAAYQEGATSLLQVLDTSRTLADARLTFYKALFAQRQSAFDLAVAGGSEPEAALTLVQSAGGSR